MDSSPVAARYSGPFKKGFDPRRRPDDPAANGGRRKGALNKLTLARAFAVVEAVELVKQVPGAFQGHITEFFESIWRDPRHPLDIRMAAAGALLRGQHGASAGSADADRSTEDLERELEALYARRAACHRPPTLEAKVVNPTSHRADATD
jgi:hypothetical protein